MLARAVTDLESNVQAYRTMAEMLLGLRKIVLHGLRKQSGDRWPTEGCPPQVHERLVQRKETELAIERLALEDEDLMSFATFEDLAETIQANDHLAALLHNLAPSAEVLCARLLDLEALRSKLARAIVLNSDELNLLTRYSTHLRETLAGARRKTRKETASSEVGDVPPAARIGGREKRTRGRAAPPPVAPVVPPGPESGGPIAGEQRPPAAEPRGERRSVAGREPATAIGREPTAPSARAPAGRTAAPASSGATTLAEDIQRAMVDEDDLEVLRLLRREIIAAAEAMYRGESDISAPGWQEVERDGWLERRREELVLEPLERFHHLLGEYEERHRSADGGREPLRELLAEREFPKLLLRVRETFLQNGL